MHDVDDSFALGRVRRWGGAIRRGAPDDGAHAGVAIVQRREAMDVLARTANNSGVTYTIPIKGYKALKVAPTIVGEVASKVNTVGTDGYNPSGPDVYHPSPFFRQSPF